MPSPPSWLNNQPIILTGSWDNSPIYRHRRGGSPLWTEDEYTQRYGVVTVEAMASLGITLATIDFFKCFGLKAEKSAAEDARGFILECKRRGIRIGAYVGSTVGYETLRFEEPECMEWIVRGTDGQFLYYQSPGEDQPFRARMYFMHSGYRAYMRKVLYAAITHFGADQIHFDSASVMAAPEIFYHPLAITDFQEYLRAVDPAQLKERLGFSDVCQILPPRFSSSDVSIINDALMQYWADFRCRQLVAYFKEMGEYIRGLNPEVAVAVNTVAGIYLCNQEWAGVDHARLLPHIDVLWNEERPLAGLSAGGVMTTKIRSYKMAKQMGRRMFTVTGGPGCTTLTLAESMAYNRATLGMMGDPLATVTFAADQRTYVEFFRNHFEYYQDAETVAEVAVLHSFASTAFNSRRTSLSPILFQQALIQGRIMFDIIFDQHLADLSRYKVLILPNQECLSDEQVATITAYVQAGRGVVITEHTSLYTSDRRRRANFGMATLLPNIAAPQWNGLGLEDGLLTSDEKNVIGKGRAAYVCDVQQPAGLSSGVYPLPQNWEALLAMVRWAAGEALNLQITGPPSLTAELTRQNNGSRYIIHLLNFAGADNPARNVDIQLRLPDVRQVSGVVQLSPEQAEAAPSAFNQADGIVYVSVPQVSIYSIIVVSVNPSVS